MKRLAITASLLLLAGSALAETRSITVDVQGENVPVVLDLLSVRNAVGADFPFDWADLRVSVDGQDIPFQIDDTELNGRVSAGDQLAFVASGQATITVSDEPPDPVSHDTALEVTTDVDVTVISSLNGSCITVE